MRGDLLNRTISLSLPAIESSSRRTEQELWRAFDDAQPRILGALYDAVSSAIRTLPDIHFEDLPRMADALVWVTAAERR